MFGFKKRRRKKLRETELKSDWKQIIKSNVKFYFLLSEEQKRNLNGLLQIFLSEKIFEGCAGITITDEIKVTVAAQACILLLGRETDIYPSLRTILVYPHPYKAPFRKRLQDGSMIEGRQARLGESWSRGQVVLSWDEVVRDISDIHDGVNLVYHEFAHQLDDESGTTDGIPALEEHSSYETWKRIITKEYDKLLKELSHDKLPLIREYAATNRAEFFAVVTEYYFEKPCELKEHYPELYDLFDSFFNLDTIHIVAPS